MSTHDGEDTVSPHENTTSPQDPAHGLSATRLGFFGILAEVVGLIIVLLVGVRFLVGPGTERPDVVAWVAFGIAALLVVDILRRIVRAMRRNRRAEEAER